MPISWRYRRSASSLSFGRTSVPFNIVSLGKTATRTALSSETFPVSLEPPPSGVASSGTPGSMEYLSVRNSGMREDRVAKSDIRMMGVLSMIKFLSECNLDPTSASSLELASTASGFPEMLSVSRLSSQRQTGRSRRVAYSDRDDKPVSSVDQRMRPQVSRLSNLRLSNPGNGRSRFEVPILKLPGRCSSSSTDSRGPRRLI